ncbi:MAG: LLM class flavin-dependent oxidoreductase [Acidimicrobiia bacterium]|nr:LLM class flavin-dependent oxidoreductase [Acidimicrobiia bacterium]NND14429.1 LLM class flavin-dependent oxidoreductase [Acidimicrobiia bacterium]
MRFSFKVGLDGSPWSDIEEMWLTGEDLDVFDCGWVNDHFQGLEGRAEPTFEPFTALAALAARTSRLRLGILVAAVSFRNPVLIAKKSVTIDHLSRGRFELGIGAGWMDREHLDYGLTFLPVRERMNQFEEAAIVIRSLLHDQATDFSGTYYRYQEAPHEPKPVQLNMPIVIGGPGEKRTIPIAARHSDHYNFTVQKFKEDTPELFRHKLDVLESAINEAGRSPDEIERSVQIIVNRTPEMAVDLAAEFIESGANHMIFFFRPPLEPKVLVALADELERKL